MTSPSRKKPRTTRPSIRSRRSDRRGAALAVAICWLLPAAVLAADWMDFVRSADDALRMPPPAAWEADGVQQAGGEVAADEACVGCAALVAAEEDDDDETKKAPCTDEQVDCQKHLRQLLEDQLSAIDLDIRVGGRPGNDYPCECRLEGDTYEPRRFATTTFTWKAAGYCHKPLYFEDWALERYGHSHGGLVDPFVSAAHFFVTLPVLPYKMGVELPWECVYPLGYYRPGSCAPWTVPAVPISLRGFAVEAATITGIVFLVP